VRSVNSRRAVIGAVAIALLGAGASTTVAGASTAGDKEHLTFPAFVVSMSTDVGDALRPGAEFHVAGMLRTRDAATGAIGDAAGGQVQLTLHDAAGRLDRDLGTVTADALGRFRTTVPADATAGYVPSAPIGKAEMLAVEATEVADGDEAAVELGSTAVPIRATAKGLRIENSFVSSVGWVNAGQKYPFLVRVLNPSGKTHRHVKVTLGSVSGMRILDAKILGGRHLRVRDGAVTWRIKRITKGTTAKPTKKTLVVKARAKSLAEDPRVVWKNISSTAKLRYGTHKRRSTSHGPRVVPTGDNFTSARYGDRPFPVVPVDYLDFKHAEDNPAVRLDKVINGRKYRGSTFNLYQEMSLKQLFPNGDIPSAHLAADVYEAGETDEFTTIDPLGVNTCHGVTLAEGGGAALEGQPRVEDGWYQLPGQRDYYGDDGYGSALIGAVGGVGTLQAIDSGCGPTAKLAYDAAVAADVDLDYSDFDTDKDGVVDFFEVIFEGVGGHGASQTSAPPYDNVWPHSSSLIDTYVDEATGLGGYISHDQLKDLEGRPLWYRDASRTLMTTRDRGAKWKVFVRVGPYNVNPEDSIDHASVISHEYGHSLGAPDYYSTGSRETYGDLNLMATDKSQNTSAFQLQEWGWVVPQPIRKGKSTVRRWRDTKHDTHVVHWKTPSGKPYTLKGRKVHNALVMAAKLPGRKIIDPGKVAEGASLKHVWWSQAGNDFGCGPNHGHNLDISLPELAKLDPGTTVTLTLKSAFEIEWDYDYGFVQLGTIDNSTGQVTYEALPSENNYTTASTVNPNQNQCQSKYGNGLTGSSTSWKNNTQEVDRRGIGDATGLEAVDTYPDFTFVQDQYDISDLAGKNGVVRFSYATDPGLAKAGWFIDNVKVTAGGQTVWSSNFERNGSPEDSHIFNGGCRGLVKVAPACSHGWQYLNVAKKAPFDHAYYLSMRDRSGFDADGHGQNDREDIGFRSGLLVEYTDEAHGYGNVGTDDPPAQSPLDSNPSPGDATPNLNDAPWVQGGRFSDKKWVENYEDPRTASGDWEFKYNCLEFKVKSMRGTGVGPKYARPGKGGDLRGTVRFVTHKGCAPWDYGFGTNSNLAPTVKFEVKPGKPTVGQRVTFNGSQSYDDRTPTSKLKFRWDLNGDGRTDAIGETVSKRFRTAGDHRVRLTVVDSSGKRGVKMRTVHVYRKSANAIAPVPGGGPSFSGPGLGTVGLPVGVAVLAMLGAVALRGPRRLRPALA
jgi:immune inhibitor A